VVDVVAVELEELAQPAADHTEDDVVDGRSEGVLDLLEVVELELRVPQRAGRSGGPV
jgi:hypothetical protein